jgi:hypothetical protein
MQAEDCKTVDDVLLHLVSHLQWVHGEVCVDDWKQLLGFRRSLQTSQVWHNVSTGLWGYNVSDDEFTGSPNLRTAPTFSQLLQDVAAFYARFWKIA